VKKALAGLIAAALFAGAAAAYAQDGDAAAAAAGAAAGTAAADARKMAAHREPPKAEQSVTQHSIVIGGKTINYTATAGTLLLRDDKDEPTAAVGYVAYTLRDVHDLSHRPITFAYNGGPGSSSYWLHMGALGPRRIVTSDATATPPPPYKVVDNAWSILDKTDLVMIDPVGTGLSRAVGEHKEKEFWGTDPDIESVSRFIKQYVSDNLRWNSPKFLLGESYGTTRSAGVVEYLQTRESMAFNGVILVSVAMDIESIFEWPGNERPYMLYFPTFAAVAYYHHALPHQPAALVPFLDEVRKFAVTEYAAALSKGDTLSEAERDAVALKMHEYTGLSVDYLKLANLRVREPQFTQELMRQKHLTVGRLDARFLGFSFDNLAEDAAEDPQSNAISSAFTAAFLNYLHGELKFGMGKTYNLAANVFPGWDFKHQAPGFPFPLPIANTALDLAHALAYNPNLQVLVLNGYYDLATPFFGTEYCFDHLGLAKELRPHVHMKYYEAGHMMYIHEPSLQQFKSDIAAFFDSVAHN
jgi:carboxypeptidase C (cathepsin A)